MFNDIGVCDCPVCALGWHEHLAEHEHVKLCVCVCVCVCLCGAREESHTARLRSGTEELMGYLSSEDTQPQTRRNKQACLTGASLAIMINKHIVCKSNDHRMKCTAPYPSRVSAAHLQLHLFKSARRPPVVKILKYPLWGEKTFVNVLRFSQHILLSY